MITWNNETYGAGSYFVQKTFFSYQIKKIKINFKLFIFIVNNNYSEDFVLLILNDKSEPVIIVNRETQPKHPSPSGWAALDWNTSQGRLTVVTL